MRQRCYNTDRDSYPRYGGRGITICDDWENFALFLEDMGERPPLKSLERKNVNGNYNKENCKWADKFEQRHNRSDTQ